MYAEPMYAATMYAATPQTCLQHRRLQHHYAQLLLGLTPQRSLSTLRREPFNDTTTTASMRHDLALSLHASEGAFRRHNNKCANALRTISLSTFRREPFYDQALSPRLGGSSFLSPRFGGSINSQLLDTPRPSSFSRQIFPRSLYERPVFSWEGVLDSSLCSTNLLQD